MSVARKNNVQFLFSQVADERSSRSLLSLSVATLSWEAVLQLHQEHEELKVRQAGLVFLNHSLPAAISGEHKLKVYPVVPVVYISLVIGQKNHIPNRPEHAGLTCSMSSFYALSNCIAFNNR